MPNMPSFKFNFSGSKPLVLRIESDEATRNRDALLRLISQQVPFDPNDTKHVEIIKNCLALVDQNINDLKAYDRRCFISLAVVVASAVLLSNPFSLAVAVVGAAYFGFVLKSRSLAEEQHKQSLEDLKKCCNWTLNNVNHEHCMSNLKDKSVHQIVPTLSRFMTRKELEDVINDTIEKQVIDATKTDFHKQAKTGDFQWYGYGKGSNSEKFYGLGYYIKNAFNDAVKYCTSKRNDDETSMTLTS